MQMAVESAQLGFKLSVKDTQMLSTVMSPSLRSLGFKVLRLMKRTFVFF